jgi:hypothetical protein
MGFHSREGFEESISSHGEERRREPRGNWKNGDVEEKEW